MFDQLFDQPEMFDQTRFFNEFLLLFYRFLVDFHFMSQSHGFLPIRKLKDEHQLLASYEFFHCFN